MERTRDPRDGACGAFRRPRYPADAGTAPGGPVLSSRRVVSQDGPEDGGGGDGRGSGAGRRRAFEAGDGLRGDRRAGPPPGRRGEGSPDRIGREPGKRSPRLVAVAGRGGTGAGRVRTPGGQLRRLGDPHRDAADLSGIRRTAAKPGRPAGSVGEGRGAVVPGPAGGGQGRIPGRAGLLPPAGETVPEAARGDRPGHHEGHAARAFPRRDGSSRLRKRRPRTD